MSALSSPLSSLVNNLTQRQQQHQPPPQSVAARPADGPDSLSDSNLIAIPYETTTDSRPPARTTAASAAKTASEADRASSDTRRNDSRRLSRRFPSLLTRKTSVGKDRPYLPSPSRSSRTRTVRDTARSTAPKQPSTTATPPAVASPPPSVPPGDPVLSSAETTTTTSPPPPPTTTTLCTPDSVAESDYVTPPSSVTSGAGRKPSRVYNNILNEKRRQLSRSASDLRSASSGSSQFADEATATATATATAVAAGSKARNMHQTSSRLLRMTDDERPFTRDFKDLFSTLMVSLPLTSHRVRFQKIEHSFTTEEAITNLGSLKFSQSNRMPDPKDPSRIVTTTTTTTFSMAKEMARSVCVKFMEARFIESVDGKTTDFNSKNSVWQLTPKGMHILQTFCQRNGINQRHVYELLDSPRNTMSLMILEREHDTDKIHRDQASVEVVFRRFVGHDGPNVKESTGSADSDSLHDYATGMVGVKMAQYRKVGDSIKSNTFTGKAAADWLMDCCTMVDKREPIELGQLFCDYGLIDRVNPAAGKQAFSDSKTAIFQVTPRGHRVAGWVSSPSASSNGDTAAATTAAAAAAAATTTTTTATTATPAATTAPSASRPRDGQSRDSNANRMTVIIRDPALRLLFREFLRDTHCEENLAFYLDVKDFLGNYNAAKRSPSSPKLEVIRETLAAAYSLYNAFLAPGSPCELNIDHTLRTALAGRMTRAVGDDEAMIKSLDEVATLFDQAQNSVFKLMASDSVPKFMREPKYTTILRERNLEIVLTAPLGAPRTSSST